MGHVVPAPRPMREHLDRWHAGILPRRILLGAFGDPGHAFPMIALGRGLAARGHDVTLQTWRRWRKDIEAEGLRFAAAPEYHVFPNGEVGSKPWTSTRRWCTPRATRSPSCANWNPRLWSRTSSLSPLRSPRSYGASRGRR